MLQFTEGIDADVSFLVCLICRPCPPLCPQPHVAGLGLAGVNPWHKGARLDYRLMWKNL